MWFESLLVFILFKLKKRPNISGIWVVDRQTGSQTDSVSHTHTHTYLFYFIYFYRLLMHNGYIIIYLQLVFFCV